MKKLYVLLFGMFLILPAYAQDVSQEAPAEDEAISTESDPAQVEDTQDTAESSDGMAGQADEGAAPEAADAAMSADDSAGTAEAAPTDDFSGESAAVAETAPESEGFGSESTDDSASADTSDPFADSSGSSAEEEAPREPFQLYAGAAFDSLTLFASAPDLVNRFGGQKFSAMMVHARVGMRVHKMIAVEVQAGAKARDDGGAGRAEISNYFGVFVVPTGILLDSIEISAPVGFNSFSLIRGQAKQKFQRPSVGINLELPVRLFNEQLPDLRFTTGYKLFYLENDARVYGYHAGMRYDFKI